jgi:hypothetical protein
VATTPDAVKTQFDRVGDQEQVAQLLHADCTHMRKAFDIEDICGSGAQPPHRSARSGNLMKWKEQLNGDCPRRDARSLHERCDLICPNLPKVL